MLRENGARPLPVVDMRFGPGHDRVSLELRIVEVFHRKTRLPVCCCGRETRRLCQFTHCRQTTVVVDRDRRAERIAQALQEADCCKRLYLSAAASDRHGGIGIGPDDGDWLYLPLGEREQV